ncbi:MAG TPA: N-6 DNA methylase [Gemmataceae bacterium]|nr:N-6 DNA methylase [Gemmataceae bacterium]
MAKDPEVLAHQEWLGYLQPVGLVVSPAALVDAGAYVDRDVIDVQNRFKEWVGEVPVGESEPVASVEDLRGLLCGVFGWRPSDFLGTPEAEPVPDSLEVPLTDYHEPPLRPTYAVRGPAPQNPAADAPTAPPWLMLIQILPTGLALDEEHPADDRHWKASPQARFERLLRETQVPLGLLVNGIQLRLAYAPRGESAGHLTFPVRAMAEVPGRPILAALHMLLRSERLFTNPEKQRLPAILAASRKYQNTVSTRLAGQVLAALFDLLRGFQAADDQRKGNLLRQVLTENPDDVYAGLLTVLLRLVFVLYAEDRGLMSGDAVYVNYYAVTGLFERLRADAGRYPDTMDQRYGAWAQLLALFRIVHDGAKHKGLVLPPRKGYLFDPDRYPFLEGRPPRSQRVAGERLDVPMVPDGVVYRVLDNLLILDGERLSYRALDVEQIGSVYEAMMGFRLEKAVGPSVAVKAHGAPVTVNLADLLALAPEQRGKRLKELTDQSLSPASLNALKAAKTPGDAVAALERKVAREVTPNIVAAGSMILQPSDERRRSGSHYTPRSLTEPIVRKALEPVLKQLGEQPKPEQIFGLKVCDPAMGSGAFLVEACRQLGAALLRAWNFHGKMPRVPADETPELFAQRMIAQRSLYGVDKNPMAVDLAKLSLWLVTLAKGHPFTFLDHALRCGDSLVGLTKQQIVRFHWKDGPQQNILGQDRVTEALLVATRTRQEIINAGDEVPFHLKQQKLASADGTLNLVRFAGNLVVAAFFGADNDRKRQERRNDLLAQITEYLRTGNMNLRPTAAEKALRDEPKGITPFHWEIEFPEVFGRENPGFDYSGPRKLDSRLSYCRQSREGESNGT